VLSNSDRRKLHEWNQTDVRRFLRRDYLQLFEAQARIAPDAVAAICGEDRITYRELNAQANQLARYLVQRGAGAETLVAICLNRSIDALRTMLAVWKAGAAFLPLDADYPPDRLAYMLRDAAAQDPDHAKPTARSAEGRIRRGCSLPRSSPR